MSKRNKKKLRRLIRAQAVQSQAQVTQEKNDPAVDTQAVDNAVAHKKQVPIENDELTEEIIIVRKEVKKILLTVLLLVIFVVIVHFLSIKTDFILKMGEWLARVLNISGA